MGMRADRPRRDVLSNIGIFEKSEGNPKPVEGKPNKARGIHSLNSGTSYAGIHDALTLQIMNGSHGMVPAILFCQEKESIQSKNPWTAISYNIVNNKMKGIE